MMPPRRSTNSSGGHVLPSRRQGTGISLRGPEVGFEEIIFVGGEAPDKVLEPRISGFGRIEVSANSAPYGQGRPNLKLPRIWTTTAAVASGLTCTRYYQGRIKNFCEASLRCSLLVPQSEHRINPDARRLQRMLLTPERPHDYRRNSWMYALSCSSWRSVVSPMM